MSEGRYYQDIGELAECDLEQANALLKDGWELIKIDSALKFDAKGETSGSEIVYILGRPRQAAQPSKPVKASIGREWEGAQWKPSMYDNTEYVASDDPLVKNSLVPMLEKSPSNSLVLGDFSYRLSKDGRWVSRSMGMKR